MNFQEMVRSGFGLIGLLFRNFSRGGGVEAKDEFLRMVTSFPV